MDVVIEITLFSGDFLRSKFVHELWPVLRSVIQRENEAQELIRDQPSKFSMKHRIQLKLLECLAKLSAAMDLPNDVLVSI